MYGRKLAQKTAPNDLNRFYDIDPPISETVKDVDASSMTTDEETASEVESSDTESELSQAESSDELNHEALGDRNATLDRMVRLYAYCDLCKEYS